MELQPDRHMTLPTEISVAVDCSECNQGITVDFHWNGRAYCNFYGDEVGKSIAEVEDFCSDHPCHFVCLTHENSA